MLRVSVVRSSLNGRTLATAWAGEKPKAVTVDAPRAVPLILKNCRLLTCIMFMARLPPGIVPRPAWLPEPREPKCRKRLFFLNR